MLEVQENNLRRAELQAEGCRTLRRQRSREDRRGRERRVTERRRASRERDEQTRRDREQAWTQKQIKVSRYFFLNFQILFSH